MQVVEPRHVLHPIVRQPEVLQRQAALNGRAFSLDSELRACVIWAGRVDKVARGVGRGEYDSESAAVAWRIGTRGERSLNQTNLQYITSQR